MTNDEAFESIEAWARVSGCRIYRSPGKLATWVTIFPPELNEFRFATPRSRKLDMFNLLQHHEIWFDGVFCVAAWEAIGSGLINIEKSAT